SGPPPTATNVVLGQNIYSGNRGLGGCWHGPEAGQPASTIWSPKSPEPAVRTNKVLQYPREQRIPLILRALLQGLLLAAINSGVAADSNIDHCCETLAQLAIDQQEQSLARELFHRDQNPGKDDKRYAGNLQLLSEQPFGGWRFSSKRDLDHQPSRRSFTL
ncbi:hypothetical protein TSMEX_000029, partial [Taenia solium]